MVSRDGFLGWFLGQVYAAPQFEAVAAGVMVSPGRGLAQPQLLKCHVPDISAANFSTDAWPDRAAAGASVRPGLGAPEREIVGIGDLPVRRILRLDHLIGNALALAIGDRVFLGVEVKRELLLHVAGRGPAHQRLDRPRLLGLIVELPFAGLGTSRLHRVFGGLKNACGHGWSGPVRYATWKRLEET